MRIAFNSKGFAVIAVVVLLHAGAFAQEDGDLQQRLQELKQQYEQTTQQLEQIIGALEQQIEQQKEQAASWTADVDESLITGESRAISKAPGVAVARRQSFRLPRPKPRLHNRGIW
jgi:predicted  nucleic acid-binding Zn-ribbon protein